MGAANQVQQCPVEGCDHPATETVEYAAEIVALCPPHADMAHNEGGLKG